MRADELAAADGAGARSTPSEGTYDQINEAEKASSLSVSGLLRAHSTAVAALWDQPLRRRLFYAEALFAASRTARRNAVAGAATRSVIHRRPYWRPRSNRIAQSL